MLRPVLRPFLTGWAIAGSLLFVLGTGSTAAEPLAPPDAAAVPVADGDRTADDVMRQMQTAAQTDGRADFAHWGPQPQMYSSWTSHSNRLIPIYTFGIMLDALRAENPYHDAATLTELYGRVPDGTLNPAAEYFDQTGVYRLQQQALAAGKRRIILVVFDGMDWQTTRAAALYKSGQVQYDQGRGTGLAFQDYRGAATDFGYFVTAPWTGSVREDVDAQVVLGGQTPATGGYNPQLGGAQPWSQPASNDYLIGKDRTAPHTVTDSASSATSMTAGIKTYNAAINVAIDGTQAAPIAWNLQRDHGFAIGVVTSVPVSHATPAAAYANNVSRADYQDISRDLLGLPSAAHRSDPLPGVDVLLGGGWGEYKDRDAKQGTNFVPGNPFIDEADLDRASVAQGGPYVVARRTAGKDGQQVLQQAAQQAIDQGRRLAGLFGVQGGHLPYQTADGRFDPTVDVKGVEQYSAADVQENPTLAQMTTAALQVLEKDPQGFWLMVEAGDVDWANHANNLDNSIGAVFSGDAAFQAVTQWVEDRDAWDSTAVILTADHGHYLVIDDPQTIAAAGADDGR